MKLSFLCLALFCLSSTLAVGAAPSTKPAEKATVVAKTKAPYTHHMKLGSKICEIQVPAHFELKHEGGDAVGKAYFFVGQKKAIGSL